MVLNHSKKVKFANDLFEASCGKGEIQLYHSSVLLLKPRLRGI